MILSDIDDDNYSKAYIGKHGFDKFRKDILETHAKLFVDQLEEIERSLMCGEIKYGYR